MTLPQFAISVSALFLILGIVLFYQISISQRVNQKLQNYSGDELMFMEINRLKKSVNNLVNILILFFFLVIIGIGGYFVFYG